ncbi:MAG: sulfatase-like hydrolase/transferase, partial [Bacteroidia bacterium]|nr:sulfatase-like hydrolase/transferase [Bacteroidia bacterium]
DLKAENKEPFFNILFTLSSHNPYDFEGEYKFGKDTEEDKFKSSLAFTDNAVNDFVTFAKQQTWWNNTLVIIMADHGNPLPEHDGEFNSPKRFHIPMLWIGGALNQSDTILTNFCSQTDFAFTLTDMLNGDNSEFEWGKNLFSTSNKNFAHYTFNKGFGALNQNGYVVYDYVENDTIDGNGSSMWELLKLGKATTQITFQDFIDRH